MQRAGKVEEDEGNKEESETVKVYKVCVKRVAHSAPRLLAEVRFPNGKKLDLEVDSGIGVTIITKTDWELVGSPQLEKSGVRLLAYGNDQWRIKVLGQCWSEVEIYGEKILAPMVVVDTGYSLMGRNWLVALGSDFVWNRLKMELGVSLVKEVEPIKA